MKPLINQLKLPFIPLLAIIFLLHSPSLHAQQAGNDLSGSDLERMQDRNMNYLFQINEIVKDYPAFSYSYKMNDEKYRMSQ